MKADNLVGQKAALTAKMLAASMAVTMAEQLAHLMVELKAVMSEFPLAGWTDELKVVKMAETLVALTAEPKALPKAEYWAYQMVG